MVKTDVNALSRLAASAGGEPPDWTGTIDPPADWPEDACALWREIVAAAPGVLVRADALMVELTVRNLAQSRASDVVTQAQSAELRRCYDALGLTRAGRAKLGR